ncbi:MAG: hypothetical protein AB4426_34405 [Xenococcaceae cyanobacterium]
MNIKAISLAAILGLSVPTITDIAINTQAVAQLPFPSGDFRDNTWSVSLWYTNNAYYYKGENLRTGDSLSLAGAQVSGNRQRPVYTWRNDAYRYQVAWQPKDSNVIRLQVFNPNGRLILNRLLYRY